MADWVVGRGEGEGEEGDAVRNAVVVANVVVGGAAVELRAAGAHSRVEAGLDVGGGIVDVEVTGRVGGNVDVEASNSQVRYAEEALGLAMCLSDGVSPNVQEPTHLRTYSSRTYSSDP